MVFCITIFHRKSTKEKQSRDRDDLSLMMKIHKAKSPKQVHLSRAGRKDFFFLKNIKQQTNILIEQMSCRRRHRQ